jgi:hypothetical protein
MVKCDLRGNLNGDLLTIVTITTADEALALNGIEPDEVERVWSNELTPRGDDGENGASPDPASPTSNDDASRETYRIECGGLPFVFWLARGHETLMFDR